MQFLKHFLDLIFPPHCEVCRRLGPEIMCDNCIKNISYLQPAAFTHAVGIYEGPLKTAIHRFKFKKRSALAEPLGVLMAKYLSRHLDMHNMDMIIPVPLYERRLRERGFNQSELLGAIITKYYEVPTVSGLLSRVRDTHPQFDLHPAERVKNIREAFALKGPHLIKGKNLLLVDDIFTTGATVSECTRVLKTGGARSVHVLTLSRAIM